MGALRWQSSRRCTRRWWGSRRASETAALELEVLALLGGRRIVANWRHYCTLSVGDLLSWWEKQQEEFHGSHTHLVQLQGLPQEGSSCGSRPETEWMVSGSFLLFQLVWRIMVNTEISQHQHQHQHEEGSKKGFDQFLCARLLAPPAILSTINKRSWVRWFQS